MTNKKTESGELTIDSRAMTYLLWDGEVFVSMPRVTLDQVGVPFAHVVIGTNYTEDEWANLNVGESKWFSIGRSSLQVRLIELTLNDDSTFHARLLFLRNYRDDE